MWSSLHTINTALTAPVNELLTRLLARGEPLVVSRPGGAHGRCVRSLQQFLRWLAVAGRLHPG